MAEPAKRDTAAAIALGAGWISLRDPGATMIVLPADHLIENREAFQATLRTAVAAAREAVWEGWASYVWGWPVGRDRRL